MEKAEKLGTYPIEEIFYIFKKIVLSFILLVITVCIILLCEYVSEKITDSRIIIKSVRAVIIVISARYLYNKIWKHKQNI